MVGEVGKDAGVVGVIVLWGMVMDVVGGLCRRLCKRGWVFWGCWWFVGCGVRCFRLVCVGSTPMLVRLHGWLVQVIRDDLGKQIEAKALKRPWNCV